MPRYGRNKSEGVIDSTSEIQIERNDRPKAGSTLLRKNNFEIVARQLFQSFPNGLI